MVLSELLARCLGEPRDQAALTSGSRTWSYAELDRTTRQRAALLRAVVSDEAAAGESGPGESARGEARRGRVMLVDEHTADAAIWALAVMRAGLVYTPVNPGLPPDRLREAMRVASPGLTLCSNAEIADALRGGAGSPVLTTDELADRGRTMSGEAPVSWPTHQVAYSIFTSGSTGLPKLVNVGHRGIKQLCRAQTRLFGIEPGNRVLQFSSLSFDASIAELLVTLYAGATLVVPEWSGGSWVHAVGRHLREHGCDVATLPPSVYARLSDDARKAIGTVVFAGEALSEVEYNAAARHSRVLNAYGPTEGTVCFSVAAPTRYTTSVGRPIEGYSALVHDPETGSYTQEGHGELVLVGDGVALGYESADPGRVEPSAAAGPFTTVDGRPAYHTGDVVELRDGEVFYIGRLDAQIKRLGHRVNLGALEGRLAALLGAQAAVFTHNGRLVLAHTAADWTEPRLRTWLREVLPAWEVPDALLAVPDIPLASTGKADKDALRALADAAAEGEQDAVAGLSDEDQASGDSVEDVRKIVHGVVIRVLGSDIDDTTSVFDAGGDSFALVQIQVGLAELFGEQVVQDIFDVLDYDFTVAGFVTAMGGGRAPDSEPASSAVARVFQTVSADLAGLPAALAGLRAARPRQTRSPAGITVTGASGFIGGRVLDRLLGSGRPLTVVTTANPRLLVERHCERFDRKAEDLAGVRFLGYGDLGEAGADQWGAVVHCGYEVNHVLPLERQLKGSVANTLALLRAAAARHAHRFVFVSAASVGERFAPFTKEALGAIGEPYSQSKFVAEAYVQALESTECAVDVLRVALVYGHDPGEAGFLEQDVFANLLRLADRHGTLPQLAGLVPVCHVDDVVSEVLDAAAGDAVPGRRAVFVQRTYDVDDLRGELGRDRLSVVKPEQWLTALTEAGGTDPRILAALRLWLGQAGWAAPVRSTERPIIGELWQNLGAVVHGH